jgi:endonuclease/exonuclease/phosphatase family metal-dependent hydrolase
MLKLMTLNLNFFENGHGEWPRRKERTAAVIRALNPDIIALQAVGRWLSDPAGQHQAAQLAEKCPGFSHVEFSAAGVSSKGFEYGMALMAKRPPLHSEPFRLSRTPQKEDAFDRVLLHSVFHSDMGPLHVFNAHFSWVPGQLFSNVEDCLYFTSAVREAAVLVGDFNAAPGGALAWFQEEGWHDVWASLRPGESGFTFPSHSPRERIDYAWVNEAMRSHVRGIELIEGGAMSDHHGLAVALSPSLRSEQDFEKASMESEMAGF